MIHILKLKYFHGTIQSPKKAKRSTVRDRRMGFSTDLRGSLIKSENQLNHLNEPLMEPDSFSSKLETESVSSASQRSFSEVIAPERLCLIKNHEDFDKSINNKKFSSIIDKSFKKILKNKFNYKMILDTRQHNIEDNNLSEFLSGHILILGYISGK